MLGRTPRPRRVCRTNWVGHGVLAACRLFRDAGGSPRVTRTASRSAGAAPTSFYRSGTLSVDIVQHDVVTPTNGGGVSYPRDVGLHLAGTVSTPKVHPRGQTGDGSRSSVFTVDTCTGTTHVPSVISHGPRRGCARPTT